MKYREVIEHFLIDSAETGELVPFKFRKPQEKYYDLLCRDYGEITGFNNARELILKARKEGFTSLWLAIFAADMLLSKNPVRYLEISYKDDATAQHYRRIKRFILSFFERDPNKWTKQLDKTIFESANEGTELVLKHNQASFYVGTASTRTGERGGTVQGCLFTESAHFPDTGIINASEIIEGTKSMVAVGHGIIVQETTANGFNHFKKTWDMAGRGEVDYKRRFFSWKDFYSQEEYEMICAGFTDKRLIKQEFPDTPEEAYLTSGECYFDVKILRQYYEKVKLPMTKGMIYANR